MQELPTALLHVGSEVERAAVLRWWTGLAAADQAQLADLYDDRWEECFFGPAGDGVPPPVVLGGRFLPHDDAWRLADWSTDWREYMTEHPEAGNANMFQPRIYYAMWETPDKFGRLSDTYTIWTDWGRVRPAAWLLPPSERARCS